MRKKITAIILCVFLMTSSAIMAEEYQKYTYTFFDCFDTVISFIAYSKNQDEFNECAKIVEESFKYYHKIFDAYHEYAGTENLCSLNKKAFNQNVKVPDELLELISYMKNVEPFLQKSVNIALGEVLELWHDARDFSNANPEKAYIPSIDELEKASKSNKIDDIIINNDRTIRYSNQNLKINLGAIAKGWATEKVAKHIEANGFSSFIINAGGNVRCSGIPMDGRKAWGVVIKNPISALNGNQNDASELMFIQNMSAVTSGDYERYFTYKGENYPHIISPSTLMPPKNMRSITIITKDSGLADLLSTTLFLMDYDKGRSFIEGIPETGAIWILNDGTIKYTENVKHICKSFGANSQTITNIK